MRYFSLFSGVGGFEVAIHKQYGKKAVCVGYSEISKPAISEYQRHYPSHRNLGDINNFTKKDITDLGQIDLLVGGFPCNDLSSAKFTNRHGLDGSKSGLFWVMLKVIKWVLVKNPNLKIIVENNASMAHKWRDIITLELSKAFKKKVFYNYFDSSQWVIQRRRRYYWTLSPIPVYSGPRIQTMRDILVPFSQAKGHILSDKAIGYLNSSPTYLQSKKNGFVVEKYNNVYYKVPILYGTRLCDRGSSTLDSYIRCIDTNRQNAFILDYRVCQKNKYFIPRYFTKTEINKLFYFPDNYILHDKYSIYMRMYGMTVVPVVISYILNHI